MKQASLIPSEVIEKQILLIRGEKVMLGFQLAELYGVETRTLNQAVKRNKQRFPRDFVFQLTEKEANSVVSHFVIPHRKYFGGTLPYVFTEHGILMLSSVLKSKRAVQVNIAIMRTFVRLRQLLASNEQLSRKLQELETKYDEQFKVVFDAIHQILIPPEKPKRPFGFTVDEPKVRYGIRKKKQQV